MNIIINVSDAVLRRYKKISKWDGRSRKKIIEATVDAGWTGWHKPTKRKKK